tara:strand:- start:2619 stop:2966 length:348 start_codon:yes stop_codon:yes gene_type:complete
MGINSTEVAYGFGQMGSVYATTTQIYPPKGMVIVAITAITSTALTTLTDARQGTIQGIDMANASHNITDVADITTDEGSGGGTFGGAVPAGVTLFGRWTTVKAGSGTYVAYFAPK